MGTSCPFQHGEDSAEGKEQNDGALQRTKPGDWKCAKCNDLVYGWRKRCRCGPAEGKLRSELEKEDREAEEKNKDDEERERNYQEEIEPWKAKTEKRKKVEGQCRQRRARSPQASETK